MRAAVFPHPLAAMLVSALLTQGWAAQAAEPADDADALSLTSSAPEPTPQVPSRPAPRSTRWFVEGAGGLGEQRHPQDTRTLGRASVDVWHTARFSPGWRAVVSDRLDVLHPVEPGADKVVNSLREAYVGWQQEGGQRSAELGRINLRQGPGYGYNPTDFFRDGSLRTLTTANPFTLRENRLGTVALRGQQLWSGGASLSAVYSPKLERQPNPDGDSLDLGSTNHHDRAQLVFGHALSEGSSGQLLLSKQAGLDPQWGATLNALLTDAVVAHAEWTRSREPSLLAHVQGGTGQGSHRNRAVAGFTYTTQRKLSLTAEAQYNGFALDEAGWNRLRNDPVGSPLLAAYLGEAQRRQELASRTALMVYATQKSAGLKNLDLTGMLRTNLLDHSRLAWLEARYHWDSADLAFQWQQQSGGRTEYGLLPYARSAQVLGVYYFK